MELSIRCWKWLVLSLVCGCGAPPVAAGGDVKAEAGKKYTWGFGASALSPEFVVALGTWTTQDGVLRQTARLTDSGFPRVFVKDLNFVDQTVRVRCRPEAGVIDQACGVMFHLKDSDNYMLVRANALEGTVNIYRVIDGGRQTLASGAATVTSGQWSSLEVTARGATIEVKWNDAAVVTTTDATFPVGKVGLWTKADSVTAFSDLESIAR